jgi:hypothetical protein
MGLSRKLSRQRGRTAGKNLRINEGELFGYISKPIDTMGFPLVVQECCDPDGPLPYPACRLPSRSRLEQHAARRDPQGALAAALATVTGRRVGTS